MNRIFSCVMHLHPDQNDFFKCALSFHAWHALSEKTSEMELGGCTVSGNCSVAGYWGPQPRSANSSRDLLIIPDCLQPMFCLTCVPVDLKANLLSPIIK
jgi:hypothetical protein